MAPGKRLLLLLGLALVAAGCPIPMRPLRIADTFGQRGWFSVSLQASSPYQARFARLKLGPGSPSCEDLFPRPMQGRSVLVMVPGVHGDGPEWKGVLDSFEASAKVEAFMFRWVPYDERDELAEKLGAGVSRMLQCLPPEAGDVMVLAHSAGGVIASYAASLVSGPTVGPRRVAIITVASTLAGTVDRAANPDGSAEARFMLDLGSAIDGYPRPSAGVEVFHLRTRYPADAAMRPTRQGRLPNDPTVGVPGARQADLPGSLGHDAALVFVAQQLRQRNWDAWLVGLPAAR